MTIKAIYDALDPVLSAISARLNYISDAYGWAALGPSPHGGYWELRVTVAHKGKPSKVSRDIEEILALAYSDNEVFKRIIGTRHDVHLHLRNTIKNVLLRDFKAEWLTTVAIFLMPPE